MPVIHRWWHHIQRGETQHWLWSTPQPTWMRNTLGDVFKPPQSPTRNACHQKQEPPTQRQYHQRPNSEYCWHSHLPRGRAIGRPYLEKQVEKVAAQANRVLGFITRTVTTSSSEAKTVICKTMVRPQMEYFSCITVPSTQLLINTLERVQHCATHWITGEYQRMASVTEMLATLGWKSLEVRSKIRLAMFYKIRWNLISIQSSQLMIKDLHVLRMWLLQNWMLKTPLYWIVVFNLTCSQISLIYKVCNIKNCAKWNSNAITLEMKS